MFLHSKITPQDQLIADANICMHDPLDQDCQFPQWHYSKQPVREFCSEN